MSKRILGGQGPRHLYGYAGMNRATHGGHPYVAVPHPGGGLQLRRSVGVHTFGEIRGALLFFGVAIALAVCST